MGWGKWREKLNEEKWVPSLSLITRNNRCIRDAELENREKNRERERNNERKTRKNGKQNSRGIEKESWK